MLFSCEGDAVLTPKPRMYPKIDFPERSYKANEMDCNFTFEVPAYTHNRIDTTTDENGKKYSCWYDVVIPPFNAEVNISYYPISKKNTIEGLLKDAFKMADKHNIKADFKEEIIIQNEHGAKGLKFKLLGPVASPVQFFMTDSTHHFVRGALYFNSKVNQDSLAPILKYVEQDIDHMLSTFQWIDYE